MKAHSLKRTLSVFSALALIGFGFSAQADDQIKVGLLATLEGPFTVLGQDAVRGAELALKEWNGTAGGKKIVFVRGSSNAKTDSAVNDNRKLVEKDKEDIMIGTLSGSEGVAVKNYAPTETDIRII